MKNLKFWFFLLIAPGLLTFSGALKRLQGGDATFYFVASIACMVIGLSLWLLPKMLKKQAS